MKNNQVVLIGNIGRDPELKQTAKGETMASFTIATSNGYFDKQAKKWNELPSDWHNIRAFGAVAEQISDYSKGQRVLVTGKLKADQYEQDGQKKTFNYVNIESIALYFKPKKGGAPELPSVVTAPPSDEPADELPF